MIESLTIEENAPNPVSVASITRASTTATVTTASAHGYASGDYVDIAGALPAAYNGRFKIVVTAPTTFTYAVSGAPSTPATGTITVIYVSDAQGNRRVIAWGTVATVAAEAMPISSDERLAAAAIPALAETTQYRFRIAVRADLTEQMRVRWAPRWPPGAPEHVMEITGILAEDDGRRYQILECVE